ncbi:MAG: YcxB family protein [Woeseiaceae bacterium]|nr:YcxB family protein [Woeseiaceae bacterium]
MEIDLYYSEETVRRAVMEFYKRTVGISLPIVLILMSVFLVYLLWSGNRSWITGVVGTALAVALVFLVALYMAHYRNSMQRFRAMKSRSASLALHDDSMTITSDAGSNNISSTAITEVWTYDEFWLVFLSRAQFFTIPRSKMSPATQTRIGGTFDAWGLKVT